MSRKRKKRAAKCRQFIRQATVCAYLSHVSHLTFNLMTCPFPRSLALFCGLLLFLNVAALAQKKAAAPKIGKLPAGTTIVLETTQPISSKDATVGQNVSLRVKYDVIIKGKTLIKGGAMGSGQITAAERSKGLGKEGSLAMRPTIVQAVDGQMIPLMGGGASQTGESKTGGSVALAAVVSPLFLLKKGKDAVVPPGYEMQGQVANAAEIDLSGGDDE